jgi:DNA-binding transcriptional LysR family regulator
MVLVVPPAHRLAGRASVPIAELDGEEYIGFTHELTIRREIDRQLKRSRVAVQVVHEFDNIETIKRAIEIGSGVALLPRPTVWQEISNGTLVAIDLADVELVRPLGIVHKRNKQMTTAIRKFIELLQHEDGVTAGPARSLPHTELKASDRDHGRGKRNGHQSAATLLIAPRRRKKSKRA